MAYCLNPHCSVPQNDADAISCATCQQPLLIQSRYRALKPLGTGGFGRTFLAVDQSQATKPRCVIKQHLPAQGSSDKASELFRQEAQRLETLGHHAQIPELLAYVEQDGSQYLIQELIEGQDLAQSLKQEGCWNASQIRQLLTDLLPVLKFIHGHNVIHRDIKPANIIRRSVDQRLFLVDMGAAKHATGTTLALTGTVIGSAEYVAPEQARGKATFASDIYSLGVTCLHLLTNVSPFNLYDTANGQWVWRDYLTQPIGKALGRVLDGMVQLPTNQRYWDCDAVTAAMVAPVVRKASLEPVQTAPEMTLSERLAQLRLQRPLWTLLQVSLWTTALVCWVAAAYQQSSGDGGTNPEDLNLPLQILELEQNTLPPK